MLEILKSILIGEQYGENDQYDICRFLVLLKTVEIFTTNSPLGGNPRCQIGVFIKLEL